jgi:hypothetical protein
LPSRDDAIMRVVAWLVTIDSRCAGRHLHRQHGPPFARHEQGLVIGKERESSGRIAGELNRARGGGCGDT